MKRIFIAIIVVIVIIAFAACMTTERKRPEFLELDVSSPVNTLDYIDPESLPENEIRLLSLYSWDEYEKFEASLSDNTEFIRFEQLCKIGEFDSLIFLSDAYNMTDYSRYMYNLIDSNGFYISLYIDPWEENQVSTKKILSMPNGTDFRKRNASESGSITYGNMQYTYIKGELLLISWVQDGQKFTLTADSMLDDYPLAGNTLLNKLLDSRTAEAALLSVGMQADMIS